MTIAGKEEDFGISSTAGRHSSGGLLKDFGNRKKEQLVHVLFCSFRTV